MNNKDILSPAPASSSLNPGPGVGGALDLSPKQQGRGRQQEKRYLALPALRKDCQPVIREGKALVKTSGVQCPPGAGKWQAVITGP